MIDHQTNESKFTELFEKAFTFDEYRNALKSFKPDSSPGPDLINFFTIQRLPVGIHKKVLKYFNHIYRSGEVPRD